MTTPLPDRGPEDRESRVPQGDSGDSAPAPRPDAKPESEIEATREYEPSSNTFKPIPELWGTVSLSESTHRFGKYEVIGPLGIGGMGVVVKAHDPTLARIVAIKVLGIHLAQNERARKRFLREGRAAAAISHPNVLTIHSVEEHETGPFLVMEFVAGKTLREILEARKRLPPQEAISMALQIAKGLAAAHARGVIHRDVKPANVMVHDEDNRVRLMDFGLAEVKNETIDLTSQDQVVGTPSYMSPEQVRGDDVDARADIFSLGCLLYALLTGASPFHGRNHTEAVVRVLNQPHRPIAEVIPDLPMPLVAIVERMLAKDLKDRFQTAIEVVKALQLLDTLPSGFNQVVLDSAEHDHEVAGHSATTRVISTPRRSPVGKVMAIVACLVVLATVFYQQYGIDFLLGSNSNGSGHSAIPLDSIPPDPVADPAVPEQPDSVVPQSTSKPLVKVAKDGSGDYQTLTEALQHVAPRGTVLILDAGPYAEALLLNEARWEGITIEANERATLVTSDAEPVPLVRISSVANITLRKLELVPSDKLEVRPACSISGVCRGITLDQLTFRHGGNKGTFFEMTAEGEDESSVKVVSCHFEASGGTGCASIRGASANAHFERCRFKGQFTLLRVDSEISHLKVTECDFLGGMNAINLNIRHWLPSTRIEITNNTFVKCRFWLGLVNSFRNGTPPQGKTDSRVCNNLILGGERLQGDAGDQWSHLKASWQFAANWWERDETTQDNADMSGQVAVLKTQVGVTQRIDPDRPDFLQPAADSELLSAGIGGELPVYIGAHGPK